MTRFAVRIPGEGLAEINGELLVVEEGGSVHEAVLDRLQRHAQERAATVEATVNDGLAGAHFVLQVAPDGSSRLVDAADRTEATDQAPAPPPPAPAPAPVSAVAAAVARARAAAAARPAPAPPPQPSRPLPPELVDRVAHINALTATGRIEEASAAVTALREALTRSAGTEHPDALEARAMEAYLAHLRGDHREATVLALSVARILCGAGDPGAPAAIARAAAAWQRLEDVRAAVVHGGELLHMWDRLRGGGRLAPADERLARRVRAQVESLSARV
ncbi:hypothetical protein ABZ408_35900 [Streptomyces tibetensis]|uniref:Tetratricopeptide repeat protein n=1 Tax=Streptomyces tibetensis TaxID=2382123 RepID=A0ABW6MRG5_9ACTN